MRGGIFLLSESSELCLNKKERHLKGCVSVRNSFSFPKRHWEKDPIFQFADNRPEIQIDWPGIFFQRVSETEGDRFFSLNFSTFISKMLSDCIGSEAFVHLRVLGFHLLTATTRQAAFLFLPRAEHFVNPVSSTIFRIFQDTGDQSLNSHHQLN